MKILQVVPELNVGGVETGTVELARHLVRLGHKAVVVSAGGALVAELEAAGALHYTLAVHKKSLISMIRLVPRLVEIIKKEEIDIVHARSRVPAWISYFACRRTKAVFVTTCHGYYRKHVFSYVMGWGKRVIALSNAIARHMIEDFGVPHERIRLVPRSVDLEKFKFTSPDKKRKKDFNVGIIARITPLKGHLFFIKAMAKVARVVPNLKIWIIGDAPATRQAYKEQVQVLTKRLGLWHCTEFLGTQRDIPEILSQLDMVVLATVTQEAFGRVIVEAQAAGVPVVATKVGGVVDIIDDKETGLLVPPADPQSMAEAVIKLFKDPGLCSTMAEKALKKARSLYNTALFVENTLKVYEEALSNFKILIIKFSSLGDVILSTAALRSIREKFPRRSYHISLLVGQESRDAVLRCPFIDELLVCDLKSRDKGLRGLLNLSEMLRKKNFDLVIDLQNNRKSHILSYLSGGRLRYGFDNGKLSFLLNHRIKNDIPLMLPVPHQFRVLSMLGIELGDARLALWPSKEDESYIEELLSTEWLSSSQKIIWINISASVKWLTKNWPAQNILKLCFELNRRDMRVVITGTDKDLKGAQFLVNSLKGGKIINACDRTTINQLASLIKKCSVYISADSSPLHIAAAVNTPVVALFGPTDPRRHMPPADKCVVIKKDMVCGPCYKEQCKQIKCMQAIKPEEVLEAVEKLL